jgi:hypothetical protein
MQSASALACWDLLDLNLLGVQEAQSWLGEQHTEADSSSRRETLVPLKLFVLDVSLALERDCGQSLLHFQSGWPGPAEQERNGLAPDVLVLNQTTQNSCHKSFPRAQPQR